MGMDDVSSHQILVSRLVSAGAGREDAEDCAQEALLATWLTRAQGNDLANPAGWATTVARRRYIDLVRQQRRQRDRRPATTEQDRTDPSPEQRVVEREHASWLIAQVRDLPEATQAACKLAGTGRGRRLIAQELGISERAVESHMTRARRYLRGKAALVAAAVFLRPWRWVRHHSVGSAATLAAASIAVGLGVVSGDQVDAHDDPLTAPQAPAMARPEPAPERRAPEQDERPVAATGSAEPPILPSPEPQPEPEPSRSPPSARVYAKPPIAPPIKRLSRPELGLQPQRVRHDVSDVLDVVGDAVIGTAELPES